MLKRVVPPTAPCSERAHGAGGRYLRKANRVVSSSYRRIVSFGDGEYYDIVITDWGYRSVTVSNIPSA